jgi:hypothetical protein
MDYPGYEALGLPIGTDEVEAQCKSLVQARYKQARMRWQTRGVEPLLRVRCAVKDGRYERDFGHWPSDLSAWQTQRKHLLRKSGEIRHQKPTTPHGSPSPFPSKTDAI